MSAVTSIEWCDRTWNPVRGCSRVSDGCNNCYAMRQAHRFDFEGGPYEGLTRVGARGVDWSGRVRLAPEALTEPMRWRKPQRVFVNSMSDLFHEALPAEDIAEVFRVMARCRQHAFQVLTKRAQRMWALVPRMRATFPGWLDHVWLGVSVEDQATAAARIPLLMDTPAARRFVSYEPALGPVDFSAWLACGDGTGLGGYGIRSAELHQIIVGGESGRGARPFDLAWARSVVWQCRESGVACFVKQLGAHCRMNRQDAVQPVGVGGAGWDAEAPGAEHGLVHFHGKGSNPIEWPEDLRVREVPA